MKNNRRLSGGTNPQNSQAILLGLNDYARGDALMVSAVTVPSRFIKPVRAVTALSSVADERPLGEKAYRSLEIR